MSFNFLHQPTTTYSEYVAAVGRITHRALDGLTLTHLPTIAAGTFGLLSVGLHESRLWLRPATGADASAATAGSGLGRTFARYSYMARYSISQIIPSLIPETQPAPIIAQRAGLSKDCVYASSEVLKTEQPHRYLRYVRSVSFRCAIAGSVLLSQVISLVNILMDAQEDYTQRIWEGREPPLDVAPQVGEGVIIRLAGETSDVTTQSLSVEGRKRFFPIFEKPEQHNVQTMVRTHGCGASGGDDPLVPVYWRVANGRYGRVDSWRDLRIPEHWLHDVTPTASRVREGRPNRLLVLEADATSGDAASLSLGRKCSSELDLDLYEVEQGFYNLECCVDVPRDDFETLRVILVDPEVTVEKGGGFSVSADDYIREMGLADVIIDARRPLTIAMMKWLESVKTDPASCDGHVSKEGILSKVSKLVPLRRSLRPAILWTPNESWFQTIRTELAPFGYRVMCYTEALRLYGKEAKHLPMFVYEKSISDSVHTTNRLVEKGMTCENSVCALFPQHFNRNRGEEVHKFMSICSTSIYNRLLRWVRERALDGFRAIEIQYMLDSNLVGILTEIGLYDQRLDLLNEVGPEALIGLLNQACASGDIEEIKRLIISGADPQGNDYDVRSPVHLAAAHGQIAVLDFLHVQHNVDLDAVDNFGVTPMLEAILNNRKDTVEWLRRRGAKLHMQRQTKAAVFDACSKGDLPTLELFRLSGLDFNFSDYDLRSPLMIAASEGNNEVVRLLLKAGADITMKDRWGQTAVECANDGGYSACVDLFVGESVEAEQPAKAHLIYQRRRASLMGMVEEKYSSLEALKRGRTVDHWTRSMCAAASEGNVGELQRLVNKGVAVNCKDYDSRTPLHIASANNHFEAVQYLCSVPGINVNAMDRFRATPLKDAIRQDHARVATFLRSKGAVSVNRNFGYRLCLAAANGNLEELNFCLNEGADMNTADYDARTAMHLAACNGHLEVIKFLLSNGALVSPKDRYDLTPLDDAKRENQKEVVAYLEERTENEANASIFAE